MIRAATVRANVETELERKGTLSALTPRTKVAPPTIATGIDMLDAVLRGGLPVGVITELIGAECTGRTTMALACLAAVTRAGSVAAWVDVSDALDAESAAASGVDLARLLWVRCDAKDEPAEAVPEPCRVDTPPPQNESRDMPTAVAGVLRAHGGLYAKQMRRERSRVVKPPENENFAIVPRCSEPLPRRVPQEYPSVRPEFAWKKSRAQWTRENRWAGLDRALRATDLLLQGGGFGAIVLDLGSTPVEFVWKIPLATWFRFRAACAQTRTSLVLLTQHPCARSSAGLVVRLQPGMVDADRAVMRGAQYQAAVARDRGESRVVSIRRPPQSERAGRWGAKAVQA